jgi:hypothetical protein
VHDVVVKNGGCITSHNKHGEQVFLYWIIIDFVKLECSTLELVN